MRLTHSETWSRFYELFADPEVARFTDTGPFTEEGTVRQGGYWRGEYHDLRLFALLREDWATA